MIVADSNLIVSCVLESEATEWALRLRKKDGEWHVPVLWRYEVMNIFATLIKARQLDAATAESLFSGLSAALRPTEGEASPEDVFALADAHKITAYDAQFVALAQSLQCPLYTQDKELLRKFPGLAVPWFRKG